MVPHKSVFNHNNSFFFADKRDTDVQWWIAVVNENLSLVPHYNSYSVPDTTDLDE
jgi:hypothetical protein